MGHTAAGCCALLSPGNFRARFTWRRKEDELDTDGQSRGGRHRRHKLAGIGNRRGACAARRGCRGRSRIDRASAAPGRLCLSLAARGDGGRTAKGARGLCAYHRPVRLQPAAVRRPERAADRARAHARHALHFRFRNDRRGACDRGSASRRVGLHHQDEPEAARTGGESRDQRSGRPPGAARHRAAAARHSSHGPGLDLGARCAAALRFQQRFRSRDPGPFAAADRRHAATRSSARRGPCGGRARYRRPQPGATTTRREPRTAGDIATAAIVGWSTTCSLCSKMGG